MSFLDQQGLPPASQCFSAGFERRFVSRNRRLKQERREACGEGDEIHQEKDFPSLEAKMWLPSKNNVEHPSSRASHTPTSDSHHMQCTTTLSVLSSHCGHEALQRHWWLPLTWAIRWPRRLGHRAASPDLSPLDFVWAEWLLQIPQDAGHF